MANDYPIDYPCTDCTKRKSKWLNELKETQKHEEKINLRAFVFTWALFCAAQGDQDILTAKVNPAF
jgi:hypothetical protein